MYLPTRRKCHWTMPNDSLYDSPQSAGSLWWAIVIVNISSISIIRRKSSIKKEMKKHRSISRQLLILRSLSFQYSLSLLCLSYTDGDEFFFIITICCKKCSSSRNEDNPSSTGVWQRNAHEIISHRISDIGYRIRYKIRSSESMEESPPLLLYYHLPGMSYLERRFSVCCRKKFVTVQNLMQLVRIWWSDKHFSLFEVTWSRFQFSYAAVSH